MAHGHPDYGVGSPVSTIYALLDMGELAARLGSPVTADRAGNVLWYDDFEGTVKRWTYTTFNGEGDLQHTAEAAHSGAASAKLLTPTTINKDTTMYCYRSLPVASKIGFEFHYAMGLNINYLYLLISFNQASGQYAYRLRYDRYNTTMAYYNSAGAYVDLAGSPSHQLLSYSWNTIKLVVDYEKHKYVRALLNNFSWDLSDISGELNAGAWTPALYLGITAQNRDAAQRYIYVDDVIITQNEP